MKMLHGKPVIRCSSLNQIIECPAALTLLARVGGRVDDESESWEGQWCHHQAAQRLVAEFGAMPPEGGLEAPRIPADYVGSGYAGWMVDFYVSTVIADMPGDWAMEVEAYSLVEFPEFWLEGHPDVVGISPDATAASIDDLKTGRNPVDIAEQNWQLLGYAALKKSEYPGLKRLRCRIEQPGNDNEVFPRVSEVTIEGEQLENVIPYLGARVVASIKNPTVLNTGFKQCRWCDAALQCPAIRAEVKRMKMELTKEALAAVKAAPDDELLAKWTIARRLLASKLDKAAELCKARLEARKTPIVTDEGTVQLVPTLGRREIDNVGPVWEELAQVLEPEDAYACITLKLEAAEKGLARALTKQMGKKVPHESQDPEKLSGKGEFRRRFSEYVVRKPSSELTIVS